MGKVYGRTERTARLLKIQMLLWQNPQGIGDKRNSQKMRYQQPDCLP